MFFSSFAWSFVYVSLPFHIHGLSPYDEATTLVWIGWSLGVTSLVTVLTSPLWGRLAGRGDPKRFYVLIEMLQALGFIGMALARTLPELFVTRVILGVMGAASTFAFIIAGRGAETAEVLRRIAAVQSAMTVGQVVGPLAGAVVAARLGFRPSFVVGGAILIGCAGLVAWGVPASAPAAAPRPDRRPVRVGEIAKASLVVLGASIQIFFLTAILPQVLPGLGVPSARTLEIGGLIIFASGLAAALGALAAPRLADLMTERRLLATLFVGAALAVAALAVAGSAWSYGTMRFVQVLCVAPIVPLVVARIAPHVPGEAIGLLNSARIAAAFLGPVLATTLLAWWSAAGLYLALAVLSLGCLPLLAARREDRAGRGGLAA